MRAQAQSSASIRRRVKPERWPNRPDDGCAAQKRFPRRAETALDAFLEPAAELSQASMTS